MRIFQLKSMNLVWCALGCLDSAIRQPSNYQHSLVLNYFVTSGTQNTRYNLISE